MGIAPRRAANAVHLEGAVGDTHQCSATEDRQAAYGLIHGERQANQLQCYVHPTSAGHLPDGYDWIGARRVDGHRPQARG